ncbi:hypothetical protein Tco_0854924 [Tanacetum coccineum]
MRQNVGAATSQGFSALVGHIAYQVTGNSRSSLESIRRWRAVTTVDAFGCSKFSEDDPDRWIFAIMEYFSLLNTPTDQHLRIVEFNLEGAAAEWFRWMSRNGLITTWARVMDIPDSLLIAFYISGLKLNLQHELLVSRPTTLGNAFSLARIIEARFEAIAEKEQNIKEKADTTLSLPSEEASPVVKGPLDSSKDTLLSLRRPVDEVRRKFSEFFEDKGCVKKGVRNVTPWAADGGRRKRVKCYVEGSRRRKRKKGYWSWQRKTVRDGLG